jgi:hypothetical protein
MSESTMSVWRLGTYDMLRLFLVDFVPLTAKINNSFHSLAKAAATP